MKCQALSVVAVRLDTKGDPILHCWIQHFN
jgi:hypothetical protein